jgi:UDP-N-acetylglucosamine 2-epimerase
MPEEINRLLTDHVSDLLLCPSDRAVANLAEEGITRQVFNIGDIMADSLRFAMQTNRSLPNFLHAIGIAEQDYLLVTIHRAENTDDPGRLTAIFAAFNQLDQMIVLPLHPRTRNAIKTHKIKVQDHIHLIKPVGYLAMITLQQHARMILTDSGGMQKEAYWLSTPCITLRDETEWNETVTAGWNVLVGADTQAILQAVESFRPPQQKPTLYGDGYAAERAVEILNKWSNEI